MTAPAKLRNLVETTYGLPFPEDLYAFHAFVRAHPAACDALEIGVAGPLELLARGKRPAEERFYNDPPEFFTVLGGNTDGLHWGYWFDDPGRLEPVVASYYANDAFEIGVDGTTLFEAVREHLESFHRDAEQYSKDDPDSADDYQRRIDDYALVRKALAKQSDVLRKRPEIGDKYLNKYVFTTKQMTRRRPVAPTRSKIGIVVEKRLYRPLTKKDPFQVWNYQPKAAEVKRLSKAAREAAQDGFPGAALKLGHDLWVYREHQATSYELLDLAYSVLGRSVLRRQLAQAIAYRERCDRAK